MADMGVSISDGAFAPIWQVTAWPHTVAGVASRVASVIGGDAPNAGMIAAGSTASAARIGPLVWWVFGVDADAASGLADIPAEEGAALDLTDGRMVFRVEGPRARDVVMRLAPIDFRDKSFPEGRIVSTLAHHMNLHIARSGAGYDVYVSSSFGGTLHEVLIETVAQWGEAA